MSECNNVRVSATDHLWIGLLSCLIGVALSVHKYYNLYDSYPKIHMWLQSVEKFEYEVRISIFLYIYPI